jgi:chromosome segregation ATPase
VISEDEFRNLPWEEKESGNWVMAVTSLDWLENSIVSIGANRKSLVKNKDLVKNYVEALKNEMQEGEEERKEEAEDQKNEINQTQTEKKEDEKEAVETPPTIDEKAENAVTPKESDTIEVSKEEVKQVNEALLNLAKIAENQKAEIASLKTQVETLKNALDNIPVRKGLIVTNQNFKSQEKSKPSGWLGELFEANGISLNR